MRWRTSLKPGAPWAVSLVIHAALAVALAVIAVRAAMEPPIVPERFISFDNAGLAPDEGLERPASRPVATVADRALPEVRTSAAPLAELIAQKETKEDRGTGRAWLAAPSLLGEQAGEGAPGEHPPTAVADEPLSPALPGGVEFAGLGASTARSVVYVVDASGPMVSSLPDIMDELDRSVSRLTASQRFGVVAFRAIEGGGGVESFMPVLVRATPQAKKELREWARSIEPTGRSSPLAGVRAALGLKPEAVFLLSRGIERSGGGAWDLGLEATLAELDRLNPVDRRTGRRRVVIKTIQFLDEDPTGTMQRIGEEHGGSIGASGKREAGYRVVRAGAELHDKPTTDTGR